MDLSTEQQAILRGEKGTLLQKCMQTLVKYGNFFSAQELIPIKSAHLVLSGGSIILRTYLEILENMAAEGIQFAVPTTVNPRLTTKHLGIVQKIAQRYLFQKDNQFRHHYRKMGGIETYSCTPYLGDNTPQRGDILAWAESSAVIFANSVLGAKTNRNSGVIDLISAVLGITPLMGLLLDENRRANWEIIVDAEEIDYAVLGYVIGEKVKDGIPYIKGLHGTADDFENMGAAMAASGGVGLYHIEGVTPEAVQVKDALLLPDCQTLTLTDPLLKKVRERLGHGRKKVKTVLLGCPHLFYAELVQLTTLIEGCHTRKGVTLWMNSSPSAIRKFNQSEHFEEFEKTGAVLMSLCPLAFLQLPSLRNRWILTNSGKLRYYAPVYYAPLKECLREAVGGDING